MAIEVGNTELCALVELGASNCFIRPEHVFDSAQRSAASINVRLAEQGMMMTASETVTLDLKVGEHTSSQLFYICPSLAVPVILGVICSLPSAPSRIMGSTVYILTLLDANEYI